MESVFITITVKFCDKQYTWGATAKEAEAIIELPPAILADVDLTSLFNALKKEAHEKFYAAMDSSEKESTEE